MSMDVAIVDYGLGNLFSIRNACDHVGLRANVTCDAGRLLDADALILPGVGAFGDAMVSLAERGLVQVIHEYARSGRPLLGICLGMQLLMSRSFEFGEHPGLDLIPGDVVRLHGKRPDGGVLKVPKVGWFRMYSIPGTDGQANSFANSPLQMSDNGEFMYFVHSYHCVPRDRKAVVATCHHGDSEFVCAVREGNVFGCQFHPEKSGPKGLDIYRGFAAIVAKSRFRNSFNVCQKAA